MSNYIKNCNNYLLLLLAFFITLSTYISTIIIILFFICYTIETIILIKNGQIKQKIKIVLSNPIVYSVILFLCYFILRFLFSEYDIINDFKEFGKKQILLLLIPVLFTLQFNDKYIKLVKHVFLTGLLLNILVSLSSLLFDSVLFKSGHYDSEIYWKVFIDHSEYSVFLCFGIILLLSLKVNKKHYIIYILFILLFLTGLFNSWGRVGIIAFFIFSPIIIFLFKRKKIHFLTLFIMVCYSVFSYYTFMPFKNRIISTVKNVEKIYSPPSHEQKIKEDAIYLANQDTLKTLQEEIERIKKDTTWINNIKNKTPQYNTSIGQRFIWVKRSWELIKEKPFFGFGANTFTKVYLNNFSETELNNHTHPHNNFIFILVELGYVGLGFLTLIFYWQIRSYFLNKKINFIQVIFPLFFLFIMLFDNYFLNQNTLIFFCLFTFIIYKKSLVNSFDSTR